MALPSRPEILNVDRNVLNPDKQKEYDEAAYQYKTALREHFNLIFSYTTPVRKPERKIVGRENLMRSMLAAFERPELSNVLLLAEAGSGKALDNETLIPVADSRNFVRMGDLVQGDMVFSDEGKICLVQKVFPQGELEAYEVEFDNGTSIVCNSEHLWRLLGGSVVKTEDLEVGKSRLPLSLPVEFPERTYKVAPYIVGLFSATGQMRVKYLNLGVVDEVIVKRVAKALGAETYRFDGRNGRWLFYTGEVNRGQSRRVQVKDIFGDDEFLPMIGYMTHRHLPKSYLFGSIEQRKELLQGLMDAQGAFMKDADGVHCVFTSSSKDLLQDVSQIASSLGIATKAYKNPWFSQTRQKYAIEFLVTLKEAAKLFKLSSERDELKKFLPFADSKDRRTDSLFVTSVKDLHKKVAMTCIAVDSPNRCFLASKAYTVTHNTALVQGISARDTDRIYLEVDLARMIAAMPDANALAAALKLLFDQVEEYNKVSGSKEVVLFMDEFHQIVQISAVAVEALKPLLADSGTRGIRVICATTYREFRENISKNQPLVERLQRINVPEPDKDTTVAILKGMAERYGVAESIWSDQIYDLIYEYTERYIPANAQPRKSLLVLDAMIGWHRLTGRPFNTKLLADVLYESEGVNVAFRVNAQDIKKDLDAKVFAQDYATTALARRLQICVADLNDHSKPMSSILMTGSTGVGKAVRSSSLLPTFENNKDLTKRHKRARDIAVGDYLFDKCGRPTKVIGVFPQGEQEVFRVKFSDGRHLDVSESHLWKVYRCIGGKPCGHGEVLTTKELSESDTHYAIDAQGAVEWVATKPWIDPYIVGALLGSKIENLEDICALPVDSHIVGRVAELWRDEPYGYKKKAQLRNCVRNQGIPREYACGSVSERWSLIQGLFDAKGEVRGGKLLLCVDSEPLLEQAQQVLWSLGVGSKAVSLEDKHANALEVLCSSRHYVRFFTMQSKIDAALTISDSGLADEDGYRYLPIVSVEPLGEKDDMVCFCVDNDEHLFQAENHIVTHNTETVKQLTNLLFDDERALIRMDMTEFANPDSLERFRDELTTRVWERPFSVVLLDEIEKACPEVTRLLLQVLDDARLSDRNGRETSFLNSYIIMTTNVASEVYKQIAQYRASDTGSSESMAGFEKVIRRSIESTAGDNKFPPELLGRIDVIVPFQPLSDNTMKRIVISKLKKLHDEVLAKHNVEIQVKKDVVKYLVEDKLDTDSDSGGARAVVSKLEDEVTCPLAEFINSHPEEQSLQVAIEGDMATDNKDMRMGTAHVVIYPTYKPPI